MKTWNVVVIKEKKQHSYLPYLCAAALNNRIEDESKITANVPLKESHPNNIAPNIETIPGPSNLQLRKEYASRF